jgi:hypothetical protein
MEDTSINQENLSQFDRSNTLESQYFKRVKKLRALAEKVLSALKACCHCPTLRLV